MKMIAKRSIIAVKGEGLKEVTLNDIRKVDDGGANVWSKSR